MPTTQTKPEYQTVRRSPLKLTAPPCALPRDNRTEAQRMQAGLAHLESLGYGVLRIGQARDAAICHRCSRLAKRLVQIRCGAEGCGSLGYAPSSGNTKGCPDSFVYHDEWRLQGGMLALEWKIGPTAPKSPEQAMLERNGHIRIVWDTPSALQAVRDFEAAIGYVTGEAGRRRNYE